MSRRPSRFGASLKPWRALLHFFVGFVGVGLGTAAAAHYGLLRSDWAFDLAFFHNLVASAARGEGFSQSASLHELNGLVNLSHAFFALPALVPVYAALPMMETLLTAQALILAAGAWPVARLARAAGASDEVAFFTGALYLSSFPLWRLGLADIRPLMWAAPALLWLAAALYERRAGEAALAALAACLCREEVPLMVGALAGGMWLCRRADRRGALWVINLSLAYFIVLLYIRPRMSFYIPFHDPGTVAAGLHLTLPEDVPLGRPLGFLARYLPPGAWPAVVEPWAWIASIPLLAYLFLLSPYEWWQWQGSYVHHAAPLLALSFGAAALGWGRLSRWWATSAPWAGRPLARWILLGGMAALTAAQGVSAAAGVRQALGLADGDQAFSEMEARNTALRELVAQIPADARVATDYLLIARLSGRPVIYCYQSNFGTGGVDGSSGRPIPGLDDVDVVLVDASHEAWVRRLEGEAAWRLVASGGGHHLYKRAPRP